MPIAQRTATSGTAASGAGFSITLPASTATGDMLVVGIGSATTTGPAAPTGWTRQYSASAGTLQCVSVYTAPYSAGLTLAFTNVAALSAWVCNAYWQAGTVLAFDAVLAATSTGNNATLPTGAPVTGPLAGDFEVLIYGWTSAATISGVASGSTIEITRANSTTISVALGRNNTTSLGAGVTPTAFSQTLSASNTRKTGVGLLLELVPVYKDVTGSTSGLSSPSALISKKRSVSGAATGRTTVAADLTKISAIVYKDLDGAAAGRTTIGLPFEWGSGRYGAAVWGGVAATPITGGPPVAGFKNLTGSASGTSVTTAAPTRRRQLVAAVLGTSVTTATPTRKKSLVAASIGSSATTASPSRVRSLVASTAGLSSVTAAPSRRRTLTAATLGKTTTLGTVDKAGSVFRPLFGTSAGQSAVAGTTTRRRALVAAAAGSSATVAAPSRRRALVAAAAGLSTVTGLLARRRSLVASSAGVSSVSGTISKGGVLPTTSVIWMGDHFEMGSSGVLVLWDSNLFQTSGGHAQVLWEDDVFKVAAGV